MKKFHEMFKGVSPSLPSLEEVRQAVVRFVIRCLSAELEPSGSIIHYISREDFWPEGFSLKLENLSVEFPMDIKLKHSQWLIKTLDKLQEMLK
mmetsp:Transcript_29002/g.27967  ORF Transcript_29002/g.27967 Transcript_29002/m.27967 type:complete len:93 (+) Transcript_29002:2437-2715(+)